jgi:S1-C subfamily serine protease
VSRLLQSVACLIFVPAFGFAQAPQESPQQPRSESPAPRSQTATENRATEWAELVAHARRAVVVIEADAALGSGFIIKPDGIIVTNYHVVADAKAVAVKLPSGEVYRNVYLLSSDPTEDLAFLKIEAVDLPTIPLGNSNNVQLGDEVLLVSAPEGLEQTVSSGLISGIRLDNGIRVLQTSAAASPGSSGGPLLNRTGEAVGVMSFKVVNGENLNFTIPINYVRGKLDTLALANARAFAPLRTQAEHAEHHRGVMVAGHGSTAFEEILMGVLDILGSSGVEIANSGTQKFTNSSTNGFMPLSALIETLPKTGADSLLYVQTESAPSLGLPTATVYFRCFDATGHLLWEEKASDVLASGGNTMFHPNGWKRRLVRHIGKPGLSLRDQLEGPPEPTK